MSCGIDEILEYFSRSLLGHQYQKAFLHYKISSSFVQREMMLVIKRHLYQIQDTRYVTQAQEHCGIHPDIDNIIRELSFLEMQSGEKYSGSDLFDRLENSPYDQLILCGTCDQMMKWFLEKTNTDHYLYPRHGEEVQCPMCRAIWKALGNTITLVRQGRKPNTQLIRR